MNRNVLILMVTVVIGIVLIVHSCNDYRKNHVPTISEQIEDLSDRLSICQRQCGPESCY